MSYRRCRSGIHRRRHRPPGSRYTASNPRLGIIGRAGINSGRGISIRGRPAGQHTAARSVTVPVNHRTAWRRGADGYRTAAATRTVDRSGGRCHRHSRICDGNRHRYPRRHTTRIDISRLHIIGRATIEGRGGKIPVAGSSTAL